MQNSMVIFSDFFSESFWQGLVGNGIAVVLGVPAGLWLNHLITSWSGKRQKAQLQSALKRTMEHNLGTLATAKEILGGNLAPTFTLDHVLLDATSHTKYDVLEDVDLCASIDHLRFEMAHLDRQIDALFRLELDASAKTIFSIIEGKRVSHYDQLKHPLKEMIESRLPFLEKECRDILDRLNAGAAQTPA